MLPSIVNRDIVLRDQVDHLTIAEFHMLLNAADKKLGTLQRSSIRNAYVRDRNKMLMITMWATGGRVSDVLSIHESDIDFEEKTIKFFVSKRKKWHTISLDSDTTLRLSNYIRTWKISGLLFQSVNGSKKSMVRQSVNYMLDDYAQIAGIRSIHPHLYRHGLATYLLSKGVPMEIIAYRLKHASTRTTAAFYARVTPDIERQLISACVPDILGMD